MRYYKGWEKNATEHKVFPITTKYTVIELSKNPFILSS